MIERFVNQGFKDQRAAFEFSGADLFTSENVNGVGKSAVLEGFKLALLGEVPGRAKNVEDILLFSSQPEIKVEVAGTTSLGTFAAERRFLRHALKGEKRPIRINDTERKFEEGDRWIRDFLGTVSVSFNPDEFLNLSDGRKRQWILSHSPETQALCRDNVYAVLVARVMEAHFGPGLVRSLLSVRGMASVEELLSRRDRSFLGRTISELIDAFREQDDGRSAGTLAVLDRTLSVWDESLTAEENIASILTRLKAEIQRLQALSRNPTAEGLDGLADGETPGLEETIQDVQRQTRELEKNIKTLDKRIEERKSQIAGKRDIEERIQFLHANIAGVKDGLSDDFAERLHKKILDLRDKLGDPAPLREKVETLDEELRERAEALHRQEVRFHALSSELNQKQEQKAAVESSGFQCPVAAAIQCDTDMKPYRAILERQIEELRSKGELESEKLARLQAEVFECGGQVKAAQTELKGIERLNEAVQAEINLAKERVAAEEKEGAKARGMLNVYIQELESLISKREGLVEAEDEDWKTWETKKREFENGKKEQTQYLMELLREQGRREAGREAAAKRRKAEKELATAKLLQRLLGPRGIQGELALRIAEALESEVNKYLKLIHADYDFTMDLEGKKFSMGWLRRGKVISFATINSAHFIIPKLSDLLGKEMEEST